MNADCSKALLAAAAMHHHYPIPRTIVTVALVAVASGVHVVRGDEADRSEKIRQTKRAVMRSFAESLEVLERTADGDRPSQRVEDCVLYFTDPVYHPEIGEGSTWIWHDQQRPVIIAQIYHWTPREQWVMGLYTFSNHRVVITDGEEIRREYRPTDFEPLPIPGAPPPADKRAVRRLQMKRLATRFSATEQRPARKDPDRPIRPLRLLTKPIHEYSHESSSVVDGAVFAFVHGTNAQIVMLLEARRKPDDGLGWYAGFGRLSDGDNLVRFDKREFWKELAPPRPLPHDFPSNYISKIIPWDADGDSAAAAQLGETPDAEP